MLIIAYLYSDPLLETTPPPAIWGWEVAQVYQDLATAAVETRPQLQQLLLDAQQSPPDYLLVRQLDELGDSLAAVGERLAAIEQLGIIVIATEQDYRTSDAIAASRAQLMTLLAEIQRNQRSRRIRQGHARNRMQAQPPPGRAPYGYRRGKDRYLLDRSAAPVVKAFFEQFILYGSLRGAVRHLERRYGKKIAVSTGRRWLENPVYRGDTAYRDGRTVPDTHQAVVSRAEAAQVDRLLRRNRQLPPKTASAPRSLAGLVACAACGSAMKISRVSAPRRSKTYLYLRPVACEQRCQSIPYEAVLAETIAQICATLPAAVAQLGSAPAEGAKGALITQIEQTQSVLAQLPELVKAGVLDTETASLRSYQLRTELADLRQQQAALPPVNLQELAQAVAIPQFWQDLSEAERRFFFREFIRQIWLDRSAAGWQLRLEFIF
ncbi:MAG: recombinase family protein [Leptolyngbya sp. SIO4C1]|nr:recombinase family protein [Leptolyngbya sp. SIO4C1]